MLTPRNMKLATLTYWVLLFLLAGHGDARSDDRGSQMTQLYRQHMALLDRYAPRPGRPPVIRSRPTVRPGTPARVPSRTTPSHRAFTPGPAATRPPAPVRQTRHHAAANAIGPRVSRGPMPRYDGLSGDEQRYWTSAMRRQMSTIRPRVLNALIRIADTLEPTGTTRLGAEELPGSPKTVTLGELRALTRATGREAGIWWDPVRRKNTIALGNFKPISVGGIMAYITPVPSRSCFLIAHTHPAGKSSPSDGDFKALQGHQTRAVAALKRWPRHPGEHSFRRFKSLLVPMDDHPVIFSVGRPDR